MIIKARGIKAWLIILSVLLIIILFLIFLFNLLLFLLPLILIILAVSYLFRILNKLKKEKDNDIIDIDFKIKK